MLFFWPIILFFYSQKFRLLFFSPSPLFFNYSYNNIIIAFIISTSESYTIQSSTIFIKFTRDTLINAHDAYITVELYNNYYICVILHARCRCYCLLKH